MSQDSAKTCQEPPQERIPRELPSGLRPQGRWRWVPAVAVARGRRQWRAWSNPSLRKDLRRRTNLFSVLNTPMTHQGGLADLKRLRPFRRPLKRRRIIRFVTFQNECQLSYNLGLEGIEIFMVSTVFSGLLHHEDSWLRCFEIVPKSLYNLPKSFKNRLKIVVCGGALWRLEGVLGRLGAS